MLETKCSKNKSIFDDIVKKISKNDQLILDSRKNSFRFTLNNEDSFQFSRKGSIKFNDFEVKGTQLIDNNEFEDRRTQIKLIDT